jgi:preprotein translocase subunit SecF
MAAGIYSSVFIATPLLVHLKEREPGIKAGDARAMKHKSRRSADRFADVPVYTDDMPVRDAPEDGAPDEPVEGRTGATSAGNRPVSPGAPGRFTAGERPASARPVSGSSSARRPQPSRKPRSQRGKG